MLENDSSNYFSGSLHNLKEHWSNPSRAKKFTSGGTRKHAISYLINRIETDVHKGSWLDTAIGAGFVQQQLSETVSPAVLVGIDFSRVMLEEIRQENILRVLSSAFALPFRSTAFSVVTNIFCFSDYPNPSKGFEEMVRVVNSPGIMAYIDYEKNDGYWDRRFRLHGRKGKDGQIIIGNIHLRSLEDMEELVPSQVRLVHNANIRYEVMSKALTNQFDLPEKITRSFLYLEYYKSRSTKEGFDS